MFRPNMVTIRLATRKTRKDVSPSTAVYIFFSFLPCGQPDGECVWSKHVADMSTKSIVFWVDLVCVLEGGKLTMAYCSVSDFITLALFLVLYVDEKEFQYSGIYLWDVGIRVLSVNAKCENTFCTNLELTTFGSVNVRWVRVLRIVAVCFV
jgi:hypothetical protein